MRAILAVPLVLLALAVSACSGGGATASGDSAVGQEVSDRSVTLPDSFGEFVEYAQACDGLESDPASKCRAVAERQHGVDVAAAGNLSQAFGGASAEGRTYVTGDRSGIVTVFVVAGDSPALWTSEDSDEWVEWTQFHGERLVSQGNADCLVIVAGGVVRADVEPAADEWVPVECRASNGEVTALVYPIQGVTVEGALEVTSQALASA